MGLYEIIHGRKWINEERATWVIGYERDGKEYSWSTSANSSGEAQRAFRDYMEGQGVSSADYRIKGTYQSTTNDKMEEAPGAKKAWDDMMSDPNYNPNSFNDHPGDFSDYGGEDDYEEAGDGDVEGDGFPSEPQEDDFQIEDIPSGGYNLGSADHGFLGTFENMDDALDAFVEWKKKNNYYPSLWFVSDHGNAWLIDDDGNEIKNEVVREQNTTSNLDGGLGQPKIPGAFQRKKPTASDKRKERNNATSSTGWNITKKTNNYVKKRNEILSKAEELIEYINEVKYSDYAADETRSPKEKINSSIKEVNRKLYEIERMINHAVKLRTESGLEDVFWNSTRAHFSKISERMLRISNRLREFNK